MKCAVIDIGSNSMRLAAYDAQGQHFRSLFKEKIMAGLAGYVEDGALSREGMDCAAAGLLEFQKTLRILEIPAVYVFATASLRNIRNTDEALRRIEAETGLSIEVLSGTDEASLGAFGAMQELDIKTGVFVDVGGASTEVSVCADGHLCQAESVPLGSLKLFRDYVKQIIPGDGAKAKMEDAIDRAFSALDLPKTAGNNAVCIGGTARAVEKLIRRQQGGGDVPVPFTAQQLETLWQMLRRGDKGAIDFILRYEPERIHTLIPGVMILRHLVRRFHLRQIAVSQYGVREGYLCQRILRAPQR